MTYVAGPNGIINTKNMFQSIDFTNFLKRP